MDRGQTYIVDAPSQELERRFWPALEAFQEQEEIAKWGKIRQVVYKLHAVQDRGRNKYGPSVVLKLEHESGEILWVWAPTLLTFALHSREKTEYILNLGMH